MTERNFPKSRDEALAFDQADPLAGHRDLFELPDGVTYLVGHSLGPPTHAALARVDATARQDWAGKLVGAWNSASWIDLASRTGARLAALIGVPPGDVTVCDSVSVNLFKLAGAALPHARTREILVETGEFPTDQYIAAGLSGLSCAGQRRVAPGEGLAALADGGVLIKSLVDYRSGEIADIAAHEASARDSGGMVVWDLSHATGLLDPRLGEFGARLAVGCTYKYLNGGPGAPAFIYAHRALAEAMATPLPGWLGHARPFDFSPEYVPAEGAARFVAGTPPILSLSALDGALDAFDGVDLALLHEKSMRLGDICLWWADRLSLETGSPAIGAQRGGHVSLRHSDGYALSRALAEAGVQTDFRTPDTIRFGLSPLFLRHVEIWDAMQALSDILSAGTWRDPRFQARARVT